MHQTKALCGDFLEEELHKVVNYGHIFPPGAAEQGDKDETNL